MAARSAAESWYHSTPGQHEALKKHTIGVEAMARDLGLGGGCERAEGREGESKGCALLFRYNGTSEASAVFELT
eukprot:3702234-Rhodomonas_salina.1